MNKRINLLAVLALFLVSMIIPINALATSAEEITLDDVDVPRIDIDEIEVWTTNTSLVNGPFYTGEKIHIKVFWWAFDVPSTYDKLSSVDVKINVELDDEEQETDFFTAKWTYRDTASFVYELPEDMDPGVYTLNVELEDDRGNKKYYDVELNIVNQKHFVEVYDVNFSNR